MGTIYHLESSHDGTNWEFVTSFEDGGPSRFEGKKMNFDLVKKEAQCFKKIRKKKYVRIIIYI